MPWIASMMPIVTVSIVTIGSARMPISIISAKIGWIRTAWPRRRPISSQ